MPKAEVDEVRQTLVDELDVLSDDIHVPDHREALTFYVPTEQLGRARDVLPGEVEVLETHEYEYLAKTDI
jgi:hypothetical protein